MNTFNKGKECESFVLNTLIGAGASVSLPFGGQERYDLIVDLKGQLFRAQVKSAQRPPEKGGQVLRVCTETKCIAHQHTRLADKTIYNKSKPYTSNEIDVLIAVDLPNKQAYWIPVEEFEGQRTLSLRTISTENKVRKNIRWAQTYEIEQVI